MAASATLQLCVAPAARLRRARFAGKNRARPRSKWGMGARANLLEEPCTAAASVVGTEARPRLTMVRPRPEAPPHGPDDESRAWVASLRDPGTGGDGPAASCTICCSAPPATRSGGAATPCRTCAAATSTTSHMQAPTMPWSRFSPSSRTYRGDSRFTTWAYKFALLEAAVKLRKRAWQNREVPIESERWAGSPTASIARAQTPRAASPWRDRRRHRAELYVASARRPRRGGPRRGADRRARRADGDHARRPLQDDPRRPAQAEGVARRARARLRPRPRPDGGGEMNDRRPRSADRAACSDPTGPSSAASGASSCSTATSSSSSARTRCGGCRAIPGMRAHLEGCPACAEDHDSLRALVAEDST